MRLKGSAVFIVAVILTLAACGGQVVSSPSPSASVNETPPSPSPSASPLAVIESPVADELFSRSDTCANPSLGYTVNFPDDWYTNTAIGAQPACAWFTPDFFEVDVPGEMPEEIWISIGRVEGAVGYNMLTPVESSQDVEIDGLAGHRAEYRLLESVDDTDSDDLVYHYVLPLDTVGPTIVASTDNSRADDYELAKAVLDRVMASLRFDPQFADVPYIPSMPTGVPITAGSVRAEDSDASFALELEAGQKRYRAGQEIQIAATLTYLGPADTIVARGSSNPGLIGFAVESDDPAIRISPAFTTDCGPHEMVRGVAVDYPLVKSGGYSPDDPLASFYAAYFGSPELRLPAGRWTISAGGSWYIGDCGAGEVHSLSASVTVVVKP